MNVLTWVDKLYEKFLLFKSEETFQVLVFFFNYLTIFIFVSNGNEINRVKWIFKNEGFDDFKRL